MTQKHIITTVVIAVVVGAASFFGGYKLGQSKTPARSGQFMGSGQAGSRTGGAAGANAARRAGGGFTSGQIISKDDKSITVQLPNNGGSKIIFYAASTQINKPLPVDATQLTTGTNVIVTGTANSDGSITAQNIQIRPAGMPGPGGQPGQGQPSSTPSGQ